MGLNWIDRRLLGFVFILAVLLAAPGMTALAKDDAISSYRTAVMKTLQGHVDAIGAIVDGKVAFRHHLIDHAVAIVGTSRGWPAIRN